MLENGTIVDGKYEILKQIGEGGTAIVYLAMNPKLNQQWVIKEIAHGLKKVDKEKVLREAKMMMKFDHPAIPRIVDIIENDRGIYIVMDYVSGQSLAYELKQKGPQSQDVVIGWGKQICNVFMYLHSLNPPIIYHDLKPGNIILKEPEKNLKLVDFGEARPCINGNAPGAGKTKEYAAPEQQWETKGKTDERTDIYCFGTTMYRLLTGKFPPRLPETIGSVRARFPELKIFKGMDNIIQKCTQTDPGRRFQSTKDLMNALENVQLWDDDYLKKLKKRIRLVLASAICALGMLLAGIGFQRGAAYVNAKDYEELLSTAKSVDYDMQINNYIKAIALDGGNPKAYIQLLKAYEENGTFGMKESQQFSNLYNQNKGKFDPENENVIELHYLIGRAYFNAYSDESDTVRSKILKAQDYFRYVHDYGDEDYENYNIACSYDTLCEFFKTFVLNDRSIHEPTSEDYQKMLVSLKNCIQDMQTYSAGDAAYTRLILYGHMIELLNVNRKGFALNGIDMQEIEAIFIQMEKAVKAESITQQVSLHKQKAIVESIENAMENLRREYESIKRGI